MSNVDEYLKLQVMTSTPEQLHMMVVNEAIRTARQGATALEENHFDDAHRLLSKSIACISELIGGLKEEHHFEVAYTLKALFTFAFEKIALADTEHNASYVAEALPVLEAHRETWQQLMDENPTTQVNHAPKLLSDSSTVSFTY